MDTIKPLGEILKLKRKEKGYSLRTLAKLANLSHTYINQLEKDEVKEPSFETLYKLSSILEFDLTQYVNDKAMLTLITGEILDKAKQESEVFNSLLTIIKYYYDDTDTITDVSQTDYDKQKVMYLSLNGNEIDYTREDIKRFLDFIALSFPNFKFITEKIKNKNEK